MASDYSSLKNFWFCEGPAPDFATLESQQWNGVAVYEDGVIFRFGDTVITLDQHGVTTNKSMVLIRNSNP